MNKEKNTNANTTFPITRATGNIQIGLVKLLSVEYTHIRSALYPISI